MQSASSKFHSPPASLCILRLSAIGDVTHVLPIIHTLRRHWPSTRITWIIGNNEADLVDGLPDIDLIRVDKKSGLRAMREVRRQLQGKQFDALLHMQVSLRANLLSTLARSPLRLGFDRQRSKDLHGLFINKRIAEVPQQHVVDGFFEFLKALGLHERVADWSLPIPDAAHEFARQNLPASGSVLVISPCSSHSLRNWLPERYARVADHAVNRHGMTVVLCGGRSAQELVFAEQICLQMRQPAINLVGKDTLKEFAALLKRADILITPDSGPAHIATCTGTPVIGLYAATNVQRSGPYLSRDNCVDRYNEAAHRYHNCPADELKWGTKIERQGVMSLIQAEDVISHIDAIMTTRMQGNLNQT